MINALLLPCAAALLPWLSPAASAGPTLRAPATWLCRDLLSVPAAQSRDGAGSAGRGQGTIKPRVYLWP